jgi:hypothetical protein
LWDRFANYLAVEVFEDGGNVEANVKVYNKYVSLDDMGPFIDGNLVLQMNSHNPQELVPAVCTVEYAADSDESFQNIATVLPWQMIYTPREGDMPDSCVVPISIDPQFSDGSVRIVVYMDAPDNVPHKEEVENYTPQFHDMAPALLIQTSTKSPENVQDSLDVPLTYPTVLNIKVSGATDGESELMQEGFQVGRVDLVKGFNESSDAGPWKFHVGANTGGCDVGGEGVEDVIFVKKEKDGEFDVPEGFVLDPINILASTEMVS